MKEHLKNNSVKLVGDIVSDFEYSHEVYGEKFNRVMLQVERTSGITDTIPLILSERLYGNNDCVGKKVEVYGQLRTWNQQMENGKTRLIVAVFVRDICFVNDFAYHYNSVILEGYVVKPPVYRQTPLGREIADIMIAVNRPYGKSDYIPCISWGRNAKFSGGLKVGDKIEVHGRIQSREYQKKVGKNQFVNRVAYELSISKISLMEG